MAAEQRPDLVAALVSLELGVESSKLSLLQAVADSSPLEISLSLKGCSGRPCGEEQASQGTGPVDINVLFASTTCFLLPSKPQRTKGILSAALRNYFA